MAVNLSIPRRDMRTADVRDLSILTPQHLPRASMARSTRSKRKSESTGCPEGRCARRTRRHFDRVLGPALGYSRLVALNLTESADTAGNTRTPGVDCRGVHNRWRDF